MCSIETHFLSYKPREEHLSHQNHMSACGAAVQVLCKRFARLSAALLCLL